VQGKDALVNELYVGLLPESGSEAVQSFGLLRLIYAEEQCQALFSMVFFSHRDHLKSCRVAVGLTRRRTLSPSLTASGVLFHEIPKAGEVNPNASAYPSSLQLSATHIPPDSGVGQARKTLGLRVGNPFLLHRFL
jgi:hypothetical protein